MSKRLGQLTVSTTRDEREKKNPIYFTTIYMHNIAHYQRIQRLIERRAKLYRLRFVDGNIGLVHSFVCRFKLRFAGSYLYET